MLVEAVKAGIQPNWQSAIATLQNRQPANAADLHALVLDQLIDLNAEIGSRNNDIYKQFWNEDSFGRITTPKPEESCRDVLLGMLRERLRPLGVIVEPEGHMVADKRADISVALVDRKSLIELKRDSHPDVWVAHETQLERFYARDRDADGFGIYGVFWFGNPEKIARHPSGDARPHSANDMLVKLDAQIAPSKRERLHVLIINVEGPSR